uniref:Uncharacterized protein n=1 Tax=Megaselia scalaris TaxID=36166 RepID=T1GWA9_MEGSC
FVFLKCLGNQSSEIWTNYTKPPKIIPSPNSVKAGFEWDISVYIDLYVCKVGNQIGKLNTFSDICFIVEDNKEISKKEYKILTKNYNNDLIWTPVEGNNLPRGAIQGGDNNFVGRDSKYMEHPKLVPSSSVRAGFEKGPDNKFVDLYVCKAGNKIGKLNLFYQGICFITENNEEVHKDDFDILTTNENVIWIPVEGDNVPCDSVLGNENNFVGRVKYETHLLPGNVFNGSIEVTYGAKSNKYQNFEILTIIPKIINLEPMESSKTFETDGKYFGFKVESEKKVLISFGIENQYMFEIGSINCPLYSSNKTSNEFNSKTISNFWIRWIKQNLLEFGIEGVLEPLIIYSHEKINNIDSVKVSSTSTKSKWNIIDLAEKKEYFPKDPKIIRLGEYQKSLVYVLKAKSFLFEVTSKADVIIDFEVENNSLYRVIIGNKSYRIGQVGRSNFRESKSQENFSQKTFVIKIVNNSLSLIEDDTEKTLVEFSGLQVHKIDAVIFSSTSEESIWKFGEDCE